MPLAKVAPDLFADLSPEARTQLTASAQMRHLAKGDHLFQCGQQAGHVFLIISGAVRLYRETPEGKVAGLHIAMPGQLLGDTELLENCGHYTASAEVMEPAKAYMFPRSVFRVAMSAHPVLMRNLLKLAASQVQQMRREREQLLTLKAPQRLGCFLMHLCAERDQSPEHFPMPFTKSVLASGLGMEPETFSRALGQLKAIGLTLKGHEVEISDMSAMESHICQACSLNDACAVRQQLCDPVGNVRVA
ncbi:MAG: Crp/Fnr family transcriptional regulator, partial [Asticcacaulis sp.]